MLFIVFKRMKQYVCSLLETKNLSFFFRVPLLCDFEPLHQHVLALHNLVKAAQSLDEMSQTITDLLNEQKAN
jgi:RB1-inducible coiled-coil protein 1